MNPHPVATLMKGKIRHVVNPTRANPVGKHQNIVSNPPPRDNPDEWRYMYNCYKTQPVAILLGSTMKYKFGYPPRDNTVGKQCGPQGFLFMGGPITPAWFNGAQIFPAFQGPTTLALVAFQCPPTLALVAFQGPPTAALVAFQAPPHTRTGNVSEPPNTRTGSFSGPPNSRTSSFSGAPSCTGTFKGSYNSRIGSFSGPPNRE